jgi:hypothetical protein
MSKAKSSGYSYINPDYTARLLDVLQRKTCTVCLAGGLNWAVYTATLHTDHDWLTVSLRRRFWTTLLLNWAHTACARRKVL